MGEKKTGVQGLVGPARFIAAVCAVFVTIGCTGDDRGAESERAVVDAYIAALNNKDTAALERISPSNVRPDFAGHVEEKGGKGIAIESVDIAKDYGEDIASAHVVGMAADRQRYDERVGLSRIDGRWFVMIGSATAPNDPNKPDSKVSRTP